MKRVILFSVLACSLILIFVIVSAADFYVIPVNKPAPRLVGEIIMWSGEMDATGNHPMINGVADQRWRICDGEDGTPNLIDRFILGAQTAMPPVTGGSSTVAISENNLPAHTHVAVGQTSCVSHRHTYVDRVRPAGYYIILPGTARIAYGGEDVYEELFSTSTSTERYLGPPDICDDTDTVTGTEIGHSHTVNVPTTSTGQGEAIETMPPYYSLVFLMYIGN